MSRHASVDPTTIEAEVNISAANVDKLSDDWNIRTLSVTDTTLTVLDDNGKKLTEVNLNGTPLIDVVDVSMRDTEVEMTIGEELTVEEELFTSCKVYTVVTVGDGKHCVHLRSEDKSTASSLLSIIRKNTIFATATKFKNDITSVFEKLRKVPLFTEIRTRTETGELVQSISYVSESPGRNTSKSMAAQTPFQPITRTPTEYTDANFSSIWQSREGTRTESLEHELRSGLSPNGGAPAHDPADILQPIPTPPMNIVILVVGTRGDVQPFVYLGQALQKRGHRVRLATHAEYRGDVADKGGLEYYPLAGDPRKLSEYMVKTGGRLLPDLLNREEMREMPEKMHAVKEITLSCFPACTQPDPEDVERKPFTADAIIR